MPKQLIRIVGQGTMLQETARRLKRLAPPERTLVITTRAQVEETRRQLPDIPSENVVGEPMARDTAACIGLAAALVHKADPDGVMVVAPADHVIRPVSRFVAVLQAACDAAAAGDWLVTIGIKPTGPAEVYGYIRRGQKLRTARGRAVYRAAQFHEKPHRAVAEEFVRSGEWYWNSGLFVWRVGTILSALRRHKPDLFDAMMRIGAALGTKKSARVMQAQYSKLGRISIDYAVLEKADNVALIEADFEWDDVGSWLALERHFERDADGNVVAGMHEGVETRGCIVAGERGHLVATFGVSDLIVIHTPDATLVCHKTNAAQMKKLIETLGRKGKARFL